jgi:RNA-directed DNA polymerase
MVQAIQQGYKGKDRTRLVRYTDDLVVLYRTREGIEQAKGRLESWLKDMGLETKPSKTRSAHTLETLEDEPPGFNFLGFEVRQYPVGKHHSGTLSGRKLGFKTLIRPSKEAIKRHREALRAGVLAGTGLAQGALIGQRRAGGSDPSCLATRTRFITCGMWPLEKTAPVCAPAMLHR